MVDGELAQLRETPLVRRIGALVGDERDNSITVGIQIDFDKLVVIGVFEPIDNRHASRYHG